MTAWHISEIGAGQVQSQGSVWQLTLPARPTSDIYHDAQLSDYDPQQRDFVAQPPLRLTLTAHSPTPARQLVGTAGFGFWNHAIAPDARGIRVPQALWFFFGAPPNHMALSREAPPHGWKAATFNAQQMLFYALLPLAPIAIPLMNIPPVYNACWRIGQRAIGVAEAPLALDSLNERHTYTLDWLPNEAIFRVDDVIMLRSTYAIPQQPLGFIAWMDNQYAIVSPKGRFGWGVSPVAQEQALVLEDIQIERL